MELLSANRSPLLLTPAEAIRLELKLNVTSNGRTWSNIGDALYDFGTKKVSAAAKIVVTDEQYDFLLKLQSLSSEECRYL
jgi:hypothetical protein